MEKPNVVLKKYQDGSRVIETLVEGKKKKINISEKIKPLSTKKHAEMFLKGQNHDDFQLDKKTLQALFKLPGAEEKLKSKYNVLVFENLEKPKPRQRKPKVQEEEKLLP